MKWIMLADRSKRSLAIAGLALSTCSASPQTPSTVPSALLATHQIVQRIEQHDRAQMAALEHYQALRHYALEYHGFMKTITAKMDVLVTYDIASGKSFQVVSQGGSGALCQRVLKRAIDSEKEASLNRGETALSEANYRFHLAGSESLNGRSSYVLEVEPIAPSKFLYRGRIWVDAADFAVARMEVRPGKNPSFWISTTVIHHTNEKINGFWLPQKNQSETKVRIGGTAVLTIDYGTYQIAPRLIAQAPR
jgi:hypothetical protein